MYTLTNGIFDSALNTMILALAPRHMVSAFAPGTFPQLCASPSLIIWDGESTNTVYGDPKVNYAFRAWHDSLHLRLGADFSLRGETAVAMEQARILGRNSEHWAHLVMAEVIAQAEYSLYNGGVFIPNQVQFTLDAMSKY